MTQYRWYHTKRFSTLSTFTALQMTQYMRCHTKRYPPSQATCQIICAIKSDTILTHDTASHYAKHDTMMPYLTCPYTLGDMPDYMWYRVRYHPHPQYCQSLRYKWHNIWDVILNVTLHYMRHAKLYVLSCQIPSSPTILPATTLKMTQYRSYHTKRVIAPWTQLSRDLYAAADIT